MAIEDIPRSVLNAFHNTFSNLPIARTEMFIAGTNLIFYVFQFTDGGRLCETTVDPRGKIGMIYEPAESRLDR